MTPRDGWQGKTALVTGAGGFLGQHVVNALRRRGATVEPVQSLDCDLRDMEQTAALFDQISPDVVLHLAAQVGGIGANQTQPADFFRNNALMGINALHESWLAGAEKFVAVATICGYPKHTPVPFSEDHLWSGYPEETNAPYGIAKKILSTMAQAYRDQHGFNAVVVYPVNLYGPGDNFDLDSGHVIPAMIRKFYEAKRDDSTYVQLWGDGSATREFLFVEDCAEALVQVCECYDSSAPLNLGTSEEISILQLSEKIRQLVGYTGAVHWDTTRPNGQPRRFVDTTRAQALGIRPRVALDAGLAATVEWYVQEVANRV